MAKKKKNEFKPILTFKPSLLWAKQLEAGEGQAANANQNVAGGVKKGPKKTICDVKGVTQLTFPIINGQPAGAHLRLCVEAGAAARMVAVKNGREAINISNMFKDCLKGAGKSKEDRESCAIKVAGKKSVLGGRR